MKIKNFTHLTSHISHLNLVFLVTVFGCFAACAPQPQQPTTTVSPPTKQASPAPTPSPSPQSESGDPVLIGAGDIADCLSNGDEETAQLVDNLLKNLNTRQFALFTAGDNVYVDGTAEEFGRCYEPSWGRFKSLTRPSPGNHEYHSPGGAPYFAYFEEKAGAAGQGYYSYELGDWHIVALNSNIDAQTGSVQEQWLRADLKNRKGESILAYWHHPLFTSGLHGNDPKMKDIWRVLSEFGADVIVCGHDHDYERFALQDADGKPDPHGIRQFVVGTGGGGLRPFGTLVPNSEIRNSTTWGVIKLTLHPKSYEWEFIPVAGQTFHDSGKADCVNPR